MKIFILFLFCGVSYVLSQNHIPRAAQKYLRANPKLIFAGSFNGKMYFREPQMVDWMQARDICKNNKMELAEILTGEEWRYVYDNNKRIDLWVGGAMKGLDEDQREAFEWQSGAPIGRAVGFIATSDRWQCLYVDGGDHMFVDKCVQSKHQVLCQAKN